MNYDEDSIINRLLTLENPVLYESMVPYLTDVFLIVLLMIIIQRFPICNAFWNSSSKTIFETTFQILIIVYLRIQGAVEFAYGIFVFDISRPF